MENFMHIPKTHFKTEDHAEKEQNSIISARYEHSALDERADSRKLMETFKSAVRFVMFDPKQTWARRGDNWHGRKEEEAASIFQRL
jgi:hypothetical protein